MRRFFCIIVLILMFFIIYFLQANFFTWFTIAGIIPSLFVIFILFIGLFTGRKVGFVLGVIFGICIDFLTSKVIGISGLMLGIVGLLGEYLNKSFSKDSRLTIILILSGSTIIYELGIYIFKIIKWNTLIEILPFIQNLGIEIIYNIILVIIFYPIIQRTGNCLENVFKKKEILTRYF